MLKALKHLSVFYAVVTILTGSGYSKNVSGDQ